MNSDRYAFDLLPGGEQAVMRNMSRRKFVVFGAAAAISATSPRRAKAFPLSLLPGIQLYTVKDDIARDAPATLRALAGIGFKEVETAGFGSLKTAAALRPILNDLGLRCPSAHLAFDLNNLGRSFDEAHALGCTYATASVPRAMLPPAPISPVKDGSASAAGKTHQVRSLLAPMGLEELKRLVDALNRVGADAKAAGLKFAAHNHAFEFAPMQGGTAFDYLLQHTDAALVNFELDCGWVTVAGHNPLDYVDRYPGRFRMIHMSDYLPLKPDWDKETVPPGSELGAGFVPYARIISGLRSRGIEHCFVEQAGPFSRVSAMEAAKKDYAFLETFT